MSKLKFIFVHGLSGWGSYDAAYARMPYWGMRGGDLLAFLRAQGFDCRAASVAPTGSAWDRACELYAQIAGARVDYGLAHSRRCRHERYGRDFADQPLLPRWDDDTRLVLLGHSFGGTTVRLFAELLAHGDADERAQTAPGELSPLFAGGMARRVHGIVALAAPLNGATAYDLFEDPAFDPDRVKVPWWSRGLARLMSLGTRPQRDGRDEADYADHDMHVDRALELNARIATLPGTYYFSVPCACTRRRPDGTCAPILRKTEPLFVMRSLQIGSYAGKTRGGIALDDGWRENDGLVNTVSARAPLGAPRTALDRDAVKPGVWNVCPTYDGDHMSLQGGLLRRRDIRDFYLDILTLIEKTPEANVPGEI